MIDVVSPVVRSRMMAGIRARNTKPELLLRSGLHHKGLRFCLNDRAMPGCPDLVFPKYRAVVFANGCFWHGHSCHLFRLPSTRTDFWDRKIAGNKARDLKVSRELAEGGWRVMIVWECAFKGKDQDAVRRVIEQCANWIRGRKRDGEIKG
jgi:DNA mismatch endonuclease, patch repair protein